MSTTEDLDYPTRTQCHTAWIGWHATEHAATESIEDVAKAFRVTNAKVRDALQWVRAAPERMTLGRLVDEDYAAAIRAATDHGSPVEVGHLVVFPGGSWDINEDRP